MQTGVLVRCDLRMTLVTPPDDAVRVPSPLRRNLWLIVFGAGAAVWLVAAVVTEVTEDTILVPNVIILGSFLVPICTVLFVLGRPGETHLRLETLLLGFLAGGTIGTVFSAGIEIWLLPDHVATNIGVGLIEEGSKALIVVGIAQFVVGRMPRDGMVLGMTVGAGFAAFESSGYALRALIESVDQRSVIRILETEINRAVLAPFGHLTWTALMGGALFASARSTGRIRVDVGVALTFVGVMLLHGFWDQSTGWAIRVSEGLGGEGWTFGWPDLAAWVGSPTGADLIRFHLAYSGLVVVNSLIGLTWALHRWRAYRSG